MKTKILVSLIVAAALTLSFSFISVKSTPKEKNTAVTKSIQELGAPIGGLASSDKLD